MATPMKDAADDAMSQIARLREQVETLVRERVVPAAESAAACAEDAANDAAEVLRGRAESLASAVRAQPLTSILIAAAIGFLLGRTGR